ncbi:MAG TPA: DUF4412 domain-containing protein [Verrucomicrobiae bacterium]|nr:DUF4412 domain-containing protein [Verrucomicrobiae bacterium]
MKIRRLVLLGCAMILSQAVRAQVATAMFDGSMSQLFGSNATFSADMEIRVAAPNNQNLSMSGKIVFDSGKNRLERALIDAEAQARHLDATANKTITISRPDTKTIYLVYPGLSAYAAAPLQDPNAAKPASSFKIETTELGQDMADGHECLKKKVVVTDDQGKAHEFTTWNATDLNKFPVKIEMNEQGRAMTMTFKNISTSKPDAALFLPPADYKKYDSPQALMQQEMMRRMNTPPANHP